ncbi:SH3 domain-containing protein [Candidatus Poriferisodalis sp.]|uniref:SH3 domain-containing protein n=1 Tax=Candidatus Poriferisodalis sp. TaxID=3101277 RepID=UPI003B016B3D
MTGPTDFPEPHGMEGPPSEGLIALKDRLPLGVALLALAVAIAALVVAVGNSDGDDVVDAEPAPTAVTSAPVATVPTPIPTTTIGTVQTLPPAPTTTAAQQVVTATTAVDAEAGEGAEPPLVLAVVGIGYDSTLNVREEPGGQIVAKLDSRSTGIVPTGTMQEVSDVLWYEVHAAGVLGWVSGDYVTPLGATVDTTTEIVARLGQTPSAANLAALGRAVAAAVASEEPESRVRISGEPTVGELSEVTMDVVGQPDDSIRGFRLRVFATRNSDGTFTLRNVEGTLMCYIDRGVSAQGLCN